MSVVMRQHPFSNGIGKTLPLYIDTPPELSIMQNNSNHRHHLHIHGHSKCNCCPYGYHIDLDFVRYCEALENSIPSEGERLRRDKRLQRKSMEVMLGIEQLTAELIKPNYSPVKEVPFEFDVYESLTERYNTVQQRQQQKPLQQQQQQQQHPVSASNEYMVINFFNGRTIKGATVNGRNNMNSEESALFVKDVLDDVCDDFERTLEKTKIKRLHQWNDHQQCNDENTLNESCISTNINHQQATRERSQQQQQQQQQQQKQQQQQQQQQQKQKSYDEDVDADEDEIYLPAAILNRDFEIDRDSIGSNGSEISTGALQNIREQMAISLNRMRDLEEQVKIVPMLQLEISKLTEEKQNLLCEIKNYRSENENNNLKNVNFLDPTKSQTHLFTSQRINPISLDKLNLKLKSPHQQQKQQNAFNDFENNYDQNNVIRKRDVGVMTGSTLTRDIGICTNQIQTKSIALSPLPRTPPDTPPLSPVPSGPPQIKFYTTMDVERSICDALKVYQNDELIKKLHNSINVGTQMSNEKIYHNSQTQTPVVPVKPTVIPPTPSPTPPPPPAPAPPITSTISTMTIKPITKDSEILCKPMTKTIGSSMDKITDKLNCDNCSNIKKRTIGINTLVVVDNEQHFQQPQPMPDKEQQTSIISLKLLDLPPPPKPPPPPKEPLAKRLVDRDAQTNKEAIIEQHSIGLQYNVDSLNKYCQTILLKQLNHSTDTIDLIKLNDRSVQISQPSIKTHNKLSNTDLIKMVDRSINTIADNGPVLIDNGTNPDANDFLSLISKPKTASQSTNTLPMTFDELLQNNINNTNDNNDEINDILKNAHHSEHIKISCSDNYCDSCKDIIKNLAKEFHVPDVNSSNEIPLVTTITMTTTTTTMTSTNAIVPPSEVSSRIPRPTTLVNNSPRTNRKFMRQNTYTIQSPTPTTPTPPTTVTLQTTSLNSHQRFEQQQICPAETSMRISSEQVDLTNIDLEHVDPKPNDNLLTTPIKKLSIEKLESILINNNPDLLAETSYEPIITKLFTTVGDSSSGKNNKKADNDLNDFIPIIKNTESHIKANDIDDDDDDDDEDDVDDDELKEISKQVKCVGVGNDDADADAIYDEDDIVKIKQIYNTAQLNPPKRSTTEDIVFNQYRSETSAPRVKKRPTKEMLAAQKVINDSLQKSLTQQQQQQQHNNNNNHLKNANQIVQKEWFNISSTDIANPLDVEDYLDCFEEFSNQLLKYMVNLIDFNGNTAMHYAVSHGNFDVVSILLDSKVCNVNQTNNAGYTCVMLVSLAKLKLSAHHTVVKRLFQMSDVNIRAKKHCQTALMLAVSHGNLDMVQMLLEAGADINIQDEDGSTSLMCAAEHGRIDIVKLLLAQPDCDSSIQDVDGSTALKISLEAGFRDIGVLLYAHEHMSRNRSPYTSLRRNKKAVAAAAVASSSGSTKTQKKLSPASTPCSPVPSMKFHHQQHHHYQR